MLVLKLGCSIPNRQRNKKFIIELNNLLTFEIIF